MNAFECATEASNGVGDMADVGVVIEQLKEGTADGGGEDSDVEDPDPERVEKDVETLNCCCWNLCCSCWI